MKKNVLYEIVSKSNMNLSGCNSHLCKTIHIMSSLLPHGELLIFVEDYLDIIAKNFTLILYSLILNYKFNFILSVANLTSTISLCTLHAGIP